MYTERVPVLHLPYCRTGNVAKAPLSVRRPTKLQAGHGKGGRISSLMRPESSWQSRRFWQSVDTEQATSNIEHEVSYMYQHDDDEEYREQLAELEEIKCKADVLALRPAPPFVRYVSDEEYEQRQSELLQAEAALAEGDENSQNQDQESEITRRPITPEMSSNQIAHIRSQKIKIANTEF